jgi:hypothetical protein
MGREFPVLAKTTLLHCVECGSEWTSDEERWRLKVIFEEQPPVTAIYCPRCHAAEFESA